MRAYAKCSQLEYSINEQCDTMTQRAEAESDSKTWDRAVRLEQFSSETGLSTLLPPPGTNFNPLNYGGGIGPAKERNLWI